MKQEIFDAIASYGVVPVISIESAESALPLADALIKGGLPVAEITFRTQAAAEVIARLSKERPELILGAGTVLTPETAEKAFECGAKFAVAPGLNPGVVTKAQAIGLPFIPGVANPTDIENALSLGCHALKFFPAEACGGTKLLKAISAPYKHLGVTFMPTGGIHIDNLASYLDIPEVMACGGTWIAKQQDITDGRWNEIVTRCQTVTAFMEKRK